jgi:F-type H+-transporting ATPase subunit epsilon
MPSDFRLSVVAPDRSVVEEVVLSVVAPGTEGYFGVYAQHFPMLAALKPGLLEYVDHSNTRHYVYVGGGFAEVQREKLTVLADEAQKAHEIDIADAERRLEDARRALRGEDSTVADEDAVREVERAMSRLRAARAVR